MCYLLKQTVLVYCWFTFFFFCICLNKTDSFIYFICLTSSLFFHLKVTVSRTILGLDVTSSRNHHAVKYHDPAIAHLLCLVWRGERGWTRKLMRWELSFLTAWRKEKSNLVPFIQTKMQSDQTQFRFCLWADWSIIEQRGQKIK